MLKQWFVYSFIIFQFAFSSNAFAAGSDVPILCYHDVGGTVNNEYTVTKDALKNQFSYLKANGYHPISLQQYIAFTKEGTPLPDKPVMLTFDDGYISFYNEVFPLLKEYNYPAMLAIVGSWMEYAPPDVGKLVSWQQLREMDSSGLVSIASHSFRSHHWVQMNVHDDRGEVLSTRMYNNGQYETIEAFKQRVASDLKESQQQFEKELGHKALAMVWPYGEYNMLTIDIAKSMGFEAAFTLGGGLNRTGNTGLVEARRGIIVNNPNTEVFASFLKDGGQDNRPMKATYLDIESIYEPNSLRGTDSNLTLAIAGFERNGTNTVFLQTFSDERKSGKVPEALFHTTVAPVKADIFSHIASKLRNNGFLVYAMMPSLSSQWLINQDPVDQVVASEGKGNSKYKRVTPFSPTVRKKMIDLYSDLGSYAYADGVFFQDDLYLTENEDFSPAAKSVFRAKFGKELTAEVLKDESIRSQWTEIKTQAMQDLTVELMKAVRIYRPYTLFARSIYPELVLDPKKQEQYAQNYRSYLDTYDYTIIMANSLSDKENSNTTEWLGKLAQVALTETGATQKVVFKLDTFDFNKNAWMKEKELKEKIATLRGKGVTRFMYYPENMLEDKETQ